LGGAAVGLGTAFTDSTTMPDSESSTAYAPLAEAGLASPGTQTGTIAWHTNGSAIDDPTVQDRVSTMLAAVADAPGVQAVTSPYDAAGAHQLSADAQTAYATVAVDDDADVEAVTAIARDLERAGLQVEVGGQAF